MNGFMVRDRDGNEPSKDGRNKRKWRIINKKKIYKFLRWGSMEMNGALLYERAHMRFLSEFCVWFFFCVAEFVISLVIINRPKN